MKAALLPDRGVVKVAGDDARNFLNGLLTTDIGAVTPRAGALRGAAHARRARSSLTASWSKRRRRTAAGFSSIARARSRQAS